MQFYLPRPKIMIPKQYKKVKRVFSKINAFWIVSGILYICFNINQINQLYLPNNEASPQNIYVNNTHREKMCFTQSNTRIYWNRSLATSYIFHMLTKQALLKTC